MHCFQVVGCCGVSAFRSLKEFLVSVVDEFGNFAVDQIARIGKDLWPPSSVRSIATET